MALKVCFFFIYSFFIFNILINYLVHCRQKVLEPLPLVVETLPLVVEPLPLVVEPLPLVVYLHQLEGLVHNLETGKQTFFTLPFLIGRMVTEIGLR